MADPILSPPPDDFQVWVRAELARSDQLRADADRKRQEMALAPGLYRFEFSKTVIAGITALAVLVALVAGLAGYKIGSTPPAPIVIQVPK
jgi:hypothetical protein